MSNASSPTRQGTCGELRLALKKLSPGTYTVSWHVLSVDTHTTTGHFTFAVASD